VSPRRIVAVLLLAGACTERATVATAQVVADAPQHAASTEPKTETDRGMLGVVVPRREIRIATDEIATIREILVGTGDRVEQGAPLVVLDDSNERGALRSAEAALRSAEAEARRYALEARHSSTQVERAQRIAGILSDDELTALRHDEGSAALGSRRAGADAAERRAQAQRIAERIERAVLRSPFDGVVVERLANAGAVVAAGEAIVHVISDDTIVRFAAHEGELAGLGVGAKIRVSFPELDVVVDTVVETVAPQIDSATRIVMIEAALPMDAALRGRVRPGAIARVRAAG